MILHESNHKGFFKDEIKIFGQACSVEIPYKLRVVKDLHEPGKVSVKFIVTPTLQTVSGELLLADTMAMEASL